MRERVDLSDKHILRLLVDGTKIGVEDQIHEIGIFYVPSFLKVENSWWNQVFKLK